MGCVFGPCPYSHAQTWFSVTLQTWSHLPRVLYLSKLQPQPEMWTTSLLPLLLSLRLILNCLNAWAHTLMVLSLNALPSIHSSLSMYLCCHGTDHPSTSASQYPVAPHHLTPLPLSVPGSLCIFLIPESLYALCPPSYLHLDSLFLLFKRVASFNFSGLI